MQDVASFDDLGIPAHDLKRLREMAITSVLACFVEKNQDVARESFRKCACNSCMDALSNRDHVGVAELCLIFAELWVDGRGKELPDWAVNVCESIDNARPMDWH